MHVVGQLGFSGAVKIYPPETDGLVVFAVCQDNTLKICSHCGNIKEKWRKLPERWTMEGMLVIPTVAEDMTISELRNFLHNLNRWGKGDGAQFEEGK